MLVKNLAPLRAYLKVWHADIPIYQKAMRSIVTGSGPKTQLTPSLRFEPPHFQRLKSYLVYQEYSKKCEVEIIVTKFHF